MNKKKLFLLSIDLEDYFQSEDFNFSFLKWNKFSFRIEKYVDEILELLLENKQNATFFVNAYLARKNKKLIKKINDCNFEIGSHSYSHRKINSLKLSTAEREFKLSKNILENITGKKIKGFRAPDWSLSIKDIKYFQILKKCGYIYDSSLNPLYYHNKKNIYKIYLSNSDFLYEVPVSFINLKIINIPYGGGFFLRFFPLFLTNYFIQTNNFNHIYFHPWELDINQPRMNGAFLKNLIHYFNLKTLKKKIKYLLTNYQFISIKEYLNDFNNFTF